MLAFHVDVSFLFLNKQIIRRIMPNCNRLHLFLSEGSKLVLVCGGRVAVLLEQGGESILWRHYLTRIVRILRTNVRDTRVSDKNGTKKRKKVLTFPGWRGNITPVARSDATSAKR
jgi:hypothetical protein